MSLLDFLDAGNGLYIEGCDYAAQNDTTALFQRFGCSFHGNGNSMDTGNVIFVMGQQGSIADSLQFGYLYRKMPDHYVDDVTVQEGIPIFKSQDSLVRAVSYSGPASNYRAIYSAIIFGALRENSNTKSALMTRYINYLYTR